MQILRAGQPQFAPLWQRLREQAPARCALYTPLDLQYQTHYPQPWEARDLSFLIEEEGVPLSGTIMALRPLADRFELSGFGRPIFYLEQPDLKPFLPSSLFSFVKEEMERVRAAHSIQAIIYQNPQGNLTTMGKYLLDIGAQAVPAFGQVVPLQWDEGELRQMIRSRYKSLINWGMKNINPYVLDHASLSEAEFDAYRRLHFQAAGRETRSAATWRINAEMIRAGQAFLVLGRLDGQLVTGALFNVFGESCYYSNAASDRSLFEKPLGHCVMWRGLLHAKSLGCTQFELGQILFPKQPLGPMPADHDATIPDEKSLNIAHFKRGFGGQTECRLDILWKG